MPTTALEESRLGKTLFEELQGAEGARVQADLWQRWHEIESGTSAALRDPAADPCASHDGLLTVMRALDRARSILKASADRCVSAEG